jgi:hypothetical protein
MCDLLSTDDPQDREITFNVNLFKDGGEWCALLGKDLQAGVAGFGPTKQDALWDLNVRLGQVVQITQIQDTKDK